MKHMKLSGLAAIAALGLMAFVVAGTASATTLSTDAAGTVHYPVGTTFHLTLEPGASFNVTDTSGNTITTCTGSTIHGTLSGPSVNTGGTNYASGTWVGITIDSFTWEQCNQTTDTVNLGSLEIMQTSGDNGEVVGKGSNVTQNIFGVSCTYGTGTGTSLGTFTGGAAPTLKITATIPKTAGGFLCPSTAIWHASYIFTAPHEVHIVS